MGVVHLAAAPDGAVVALKMLRPSVVGGAEGRARMAREVASLSRVRGPRVAEVIDSDLDSDPPYLVTRYVPGPSLQQVVEQHGSMRPPAVLSVATGLLEALGTVHAAGVVHRDLKPGNVLMPSKDGPVLIDFGVAHAVEDSRLTLTGVVLGTPAYLAPEAVMGAAPTPATDIHGWAATVLFAATGKTPYGRGPDVVLLDRIRRGDVDVFALSDLGALGEWLLAALALDPQSRPDLATLKRAMDDVAARIGGRSLPIDPTASAAESVNRAAPVPAPPTKVDARNPSPNPGLTPGLAPGLTPGPTRTPYPTPPAGTRPADPPTASTSNVDPTAPTSPNPASRAAPAAPTTPAGLVQPPVPVPGPAGTDPAAVWSVPAQPRTSLPLRSAAYGAPWVRLWAISIAAVLAAGAAFAIFPVLVLAGLGVAAAVGRLARRARIGLLHRRMLRGPRRGDVAGVLARSPGYAVPAVFGSLLQILFAGTGALVAAAGVGLFADSPRVAPFAAGVAAVVLMWWGPFSGKARWGMRWLAGPMLSRATPTWTVAAILLVLAWGLGMAWESYGTSWDPVPPTFADRVLQ